MVMRATNSLCLLLAILCTTKIYIHAFVVHSGACHVTSGSAGLLPTAGVGRHATSACLSGTTARGQGSFVGPPLIQSALAGGRRAVRRSRSNAGRSMCMLMDSTILGIGGPELFVILAVGYFALGPVELFKLTKAAGVLVGQLKDIGLGTATNLGNIMNDQIKQADKIASGKIPAWDVDPEASQYSSADEDDDGYEDVLVDEFGRVVVNSEVRPSPVAEDEEPFWEGWGDKARETASDLGLDFSSEQDPVKSVSKFAEQLSGKVNEKVMGMSGRTSTEQTFAEAAEEDSAELGMGKSWTSGFEKPSAADYELANDVPAELSMEEQFERLEAISSLEEERMMAMQRLEAKIEAKIGNIKNELLEIVDEDYRERRAKVDQNFSERRRAKGAAAAAAPAPITTDGKGAGGKDHKVELNGEGEGAQAQMASKETAGVVGDRV